MRILSWHVHGSWLTAFLQGGHDYLLPLVADRGPDGRGRARTWDWPARAREVPLVELSDEAVDVVVLQRPVELELVRRHLQREPGAEVPAVYVEHNTPGGSAFASRHPLADQELIPIVHVTAFNALMWDSGRAPVRVIEHGVVDPGYRYTGELPRVAVVVNEPLRRGRAVGTDLLAPLAAHLPLDVFGMGVADLLHQPELSGADVAVYQDLPQDELHAELARRRAYLHLSRWTSLGLSLLEAMHLGLPVAALATTDAPHALSDPQVGTVSSELPVLLAAARQYLAEPDLARAVGARGRVAALSRYGLHRFLTDWDHQLKEVSG